MEKIAAQDIGFLKAESREMPNHIGGLTLLRPSSNADDFARELVSWLRGFPANRPPFNQIPGKGPANLLRPTARRPAIWKTIPPEDISVDDHVRLWAIPRPGGKHELAEMVARLHEPVLDRSKPLWEYHVLGGIEGGLVAIYSKIHHSLMDGMAGMSMWDMPQSPDGPDQPPMWHTSSPRAKEPTKRGLPLFDQFDRYKTAFARARAAPQFANYMKDLVTPAIKGETDGLHAMFMAPRTILNGRITARRSYAMAAVPIAGCKEIAKARGATLNDVFLALCGGALRRYLATREDLPADAPLIAAVPVAIARQGSERNAVAGVFASLGTNVEDPLERLEAVRHSTAAGKKRMRELPADAVQLYTSVVLAGMPLLTFGTKLLEDSSKQMISLTLSSVPGPPRSYLRGAEIESVYSVSMLAIGSALNVTVLTYADMASFGLVACPDAVPDVHEIAESIEAAYHELEVAVRRGHNAPSTAAKAELPRSPAPAKRGRGGKRAATKVTPARTAAKAPSPGSKVESEPRPVTSRRKRGSAKPAAESEASKARKPGAKKKSAE